jgi:hypothetical protein
MYATTTAALMGKRSITRVPTGLVSDIAHMKTAVYHGGLGHSVIELFQVDPNILVVSLQVSLDIIDLP